MFQYNVRLLTGIPRSGTTLCCHILNQQQNCIALHEPINPNKINIYPENAFSVTNFEAKRLFGAIKQGLPFEHGDKGGLTVSNPVGLIVNKKTGVRAQSAERGKVIIKDYIAKPFNLIIKQNGLFAAYANQLVSQINTVCIVRNPIDVLLSWWTVDLPINRGRLPAGEQNSPNLQQRLQHKSVFKRQLTIYTWFCEQFKNAGIPHLCYEDIVQSNGKTLTDAFNVQNPSLKPLDFQTRVFPPEIVKKLEMHAEAISKLDTQGYYSSQQIVDRLAEVLANNV